MKNSDPSKKNNPNHRKTVYLINISVLCGIILVMSAAVLFLMSRLSSAENELSLIHQDMNATNEHAKSLYTSEEVDEMVAKAQEVASLEAERSVEQQIQASLESGKTVESMLRDMFPDNFVISSGDRFYFYPILKNVKTNLYSSSDFAKDENGRLFYQGTDKEVSCDFGIDVSSNNGWIDWARAASDGVKFALIRAAYSENDGTFKVDSMFARNVSGAESNGITAGVYYRLLVTTDDEAREDAEKLVALLEEQGDKIQGPIAVAFIRPDEDSRAFGQSKNSWTSHVANFIAVLNANGYEGMIYGNNVSFSMMLDISVFEENEKWIAGGNGSLYFPYRFSYWQYGEGNVDGIDGKVKYDLHIYKDQS